MSLLVLLKSSGGAATPTVVPEARRRSPSRGLLVARRQGRPHPVPAQVVATPPAYRSDPRRGVRVVFRGRPRNLWQPQTIYDNFTRATLTSSWITTASPVTLNGSAVVASSAANFQRWASPVTNGGNGTTAFAQATYKGGTFVGVSVAMAAFAQGSTLAAAEPFYAFRQLGAAGGTAIVVRAGGYTTLVSSAVNLVANDVIRLEYDGTTLVAYINGTQVLAVAPASPISLTSQPFAGFVHGATTEVGTVLLDDWSGGSVIAGGVAAPAVPGIPGRRVVSPRSVALRRRRVEVVPPQIVVTPPVGKVSDAQRAVRRFALLPRRDRSVEVVPPQATPPPETRRRGARGFMPRRRSRVEVVPPQIVVAPPTYAPDTRRRIVRGFATRRRRPVEVVPPQIVVTPPAYVPTIPDAHTLRGTPRRGRHVVVVPPQVTPTPPRYVPSMPDQHTLRGVPRRSRRADVPPTQAPSHRGQPRRPLRILGRKVRRAATVLASVVAPTTPMVPEVTLVAAVHDHTLVAAVHGHTLTAATQARTLTAPTEARTLTAAVLDHTLEV